jgi:predicted RNase H-like HicB family nuclease
MQPHYHVNLFWHEPDDCWVADVPDLQFCSAFGATREEALAEVQIAIEGWIEAATTAGIAIPEARYRPAIYGARSAA